MTLDAFRKLALRFPEWHESSHVGRPDFRVGKKVFATLYQSRHGQRSRSASALPDDRAHLTAGFAEDQQ